MASASVKGGCFCGKIRYSASVAPLGTMVCHCRTCQRIAGAPAVAWSTFPRRRFRVTKGKPRVLRSSAGVRRQFCAACGTHLTYESARFPDEIDVSTATMDDPNPHSPTHHSWLSHSIGWVRFGDGLPQYPQSRDSHD
jgi:hypothetical protein